MWPRPGCAAQMAMATGPADLNLGLVLPPAPSLQPLPGKMLGKAEPPLIVPP